MKNIRPITDLRKTNEISELCHEVKMPIYITKNGYNDLVIMSDEYFNSITNNYQIQDIKSKSVRKVDYQCDKQVQCYSLIRVGCASNDILVANVTHNTQSIIDIIESKKDRDLDILIFPELSMTGYTCSDLFYQSSLIDAVYKNIDILLNKTIGNDTLIFVGAPLIKDSKLYNCAIAMCDGKILGVVAKRHLPGYNEFYENRQFIEYHEDNSTIFINGKEYIFGNKLIFVNKNQIEEKIACEICEDLWAIDTPSTSHCLAGANIVVNLSASNETINKSEFRKNLVLQSSARMICGYAYSSAGVGESTQDVIYSAHNIIAQNGEMINESKLFENEYIEGEFDLELIMNKRKKNSSFINPCSEGYDFIYFSKKNNVKKSLTYIDTNPFINEEVDYKKIIKMQAIGLKSRMKHIHCDHVVLGLSGGLDSTLALLICVEAFKLLNIDSKNIITITMPCFGTSKRTYNNAVALTNLLNTTLIEVDISSSVTMHLKDIDHDIKNTNVVYENAQARERTQVLFDYANKINGIVVGTGDLSELALGWCTFNGDHMSNYGVNASLPKTLVKHIVSEYAKDNPHLYEILKDVVDTPVSPELLPTVDNQIVQKTEDVVGPYELHDFFLYHLLNNCFSTKKIYYLACITFKGKYDEETIRKWLKKFIIRFFQSQFKRSTLPDGAKISPISLSPRGDFRMSSDSSMDDFLDF